MRLHPSLALVACVIGASLIPSTAAADQPTTDEFSPVGDVFLCDETLLTIQSGTIVTREHEHELRSGRVRAIFVSLSKGVTATDEEGVVYRGTGVVHGNFTFDPEVEGSEVGFVHEKLNFIGPGGLFGTEDLRISRKKEDPLGDFTERDEGTCRLVG